MTRNVGLCLLSTLLIGLLPAPREAASAQAPGYAEIISPHAGDSLAGVVTIEGTADHPAFVRYELAFASASNPTDTWFRLGEPLDTRVRQATLGLWDTSNLTPGIYQLRLTVHLEAGAVLQDTVGDLHVGLPPSRPSASPTPPAPGTATATPTPTRPPAAVQPPPAQPSGDPVGAAVVIGGATAAGLLLLLAGFLPLRRRLAVWAGSIRMRRILRREEQQRQGRRRR